VGHDSNTVLDVTVSDTHSRCDPGETEVSVRMSVLLQWDRRACERRAGSVAATTVRHDV